jgi:hypothetical protein
MQTNLKSDNFCGYNQEASPFFWVFMPDQYQNTYAIGEVGVPVSGGSAGSYVRSDVIDVSSFLSGRDNILSKCTPPVPNLDSLNKPELLPVNQEDIQMLVPKYTKNLRSANLIDSIEYNRWEPYLPVEPQNLRYVIEDFANQRGGFNSRNYVKSAWSNQNNVENFPKDACMTNLNPNMLCGKECSSITGYPGVNKLTGSINDVNFKGPEKPEGQPNYPFMGITSQQIASVGAAPCGPQFFSGVNYDKGSCPDIKPQVLKNM